MQVKNDIPALLAAEDQELPVRVTFGSSFVRSFVFCMAFLILLPFYISLPVMIGQRALHGLLAENWGLLVLWLAFTALMGLLFAELMFSIRARVNLGSEGVRLTLPVSRGATPWLSYKHHEFDYRNIQAIETRREIYGGAVVPVLLKGARVLLKDGTDIKLGYVSEANVDPLFPYPEIAAEIAKRARLPLIDRGSVRRSAHSKLMGFRSAGTAGLIDDFEIEHLNRAHNIFMLALVGVLLVLMAIGIVEDFSNGSPIGQTAALVTQLA